MLRSGDLAFRFTSNRLCLDLLATMGEAGHRNIERIATPIDFARWIKAARLADAELLVSPDDVASAHQVRAALRSLLTDVLAGNEPEGDAISLLNATARKPLPRPELMSDGRTVRLRADAPGQAALSAVARDALTLLGGEDLARVKQCSDPTCNMFFFDESRGNNRIWCATVGRGCGNKAKKRAFRRRKAEQA
ncbi:ABATE domain-containing protein [Fertoebacter nigrum]|uniref:ABATE domain-containing protein n=1 Tax=Fertoeibacter niger TaxID=2656921 RepID=A0A8X8H224_9RHOB|nr:CGNR zinc finger domain-containing protein [Fertoeibacter niger]NUB45821.1 ABATE domain-containing protein [Fertoeibacter niger]